MHWVVQNNLFNERGFHTLMQVLEHGGIPHTLVKVIPFGGGVEPVVDVAGPVIVMGSLSLTRYAKERGWTPGAFLNENFDFRVWREHLGEHLLNADARVCRFADVPRTDGPFFIRPCLDDKSFSGMVTTWEEFSAWRDSVLGLDEDTTVSADTWVAVSAPRHIQREYRMVVVDGRVITGTRYKLGDRVMSSAEVEPEVESFAQAMAGRWGPDRAYALDVFMHDGGLYVGEINNLNSAGFYAYDVGKMVAAIEAMRW
ncbi:ATP-grasp domain-containing protein [Pyxidicoccus fallax]|uniref:ATP-grasp domain-containing protein n=1 Tax=Pyxidicoccus fallax TaxID=394095 RepID=A0A848L8L7_9BACT|nr:ATP-grasp domain-containing protein [Pyxidicoccus fallax]NMO14592.1 ATP-grasp domain-containing protein [Pyxidicoccus fallax]NPC78931.1 ATP-grasp domain-containing protein [Pyxidicoccus fallax]